MLAMVSVVENSGKEVIVVVLTKGSAAKGSNPADVERELREKLGQVFNGWTVEKIFVGSL